MPEIQDYHYQFHKRGDHLVIFFIINRESGATSYYQYMSIDGYWYVMKEVRNGAQVASTYSAVVKTSASTGWTNRATLTYNTPDEVWGE